MTSMRVLWLLLGMSWLAAEIVVARRNRFNPDAVVDSETQSESRLWRAAIAGLAAALFVKTLHWAPIPVAYLPRQALALPLFAAGLALRFHAVGILGRFFTTGVAILNSHDLITSGPYRLVRHPSYAGLLLAFAAAGIAMGDFIALLVLVIPTFFAVRNRIEVEELMLQKRFGQAYADYCLVTKRLIPHIY
jgi:protein-S-isoprenylcysteine O-methyltransferase